MQSIDIVGEIRELLDREDLTNYAIGKGAGVGIETVRRLRKGIRPIERLSVDTAQRLLDYKNRLLG